MKTIELLKIQKCGNSIRYEFRYSDELKKYFTGQDFCITYPDNIEQVPDGVLAVPFATCTLQISWFTDCELIIPELDRDFYESIPYFLDGYKNMYPEVLFAGKLTVGRVVDCRPKKTGSCATMFSGGLDATTTLLRHIDEHPHLISIWGSDVNYDNENGWQIVEQGLRKTAEQYSLPLAVIRTRFIQFDNAIRLTEDFGEVLQTSWWYGVKHGIGLLGHVAPYAWLHGINVLYIASSNCYNDGPVRCASDPIIDNHLEYCGTTICHDAFDMDRMSKTKYLVQYHQDHPDEKIHVHVCWSSGSGENCCICEKCCRTMMGFMIAGADPQHFGFLHGRDALDKIYQQIALRYDKIASYSSWRFMQQEVREKWDDLAVLPYRDKMKWMLDFDFEHPEENECRKQYRATWKYKEKLVKTFPWLYKLYIKLRGYSFE